MIKYEIEELDKVVGSRYALVIAAAKRARQINDYLNAIRRQEMPHVVPPQVELEEAIQGKPISIAMKEILEGKVLVERPAEKPGVQAT